MNTDNDTGRSPERGPDEKDDLSRLVDDMEEGIIDERDESTPGRRKAGPDTPLPSSDTSNGQEPPD